MLCGLCSCRVYSNQRDPGSYVLRSLPRFYDENTSIAMKTFAPVLQHRALVRLAHWKVETAIHCIAAVFLNG